MNPAPFEKHAAIELKAAQMLPHCGNEPAILLETAYRKTIQAVPQAVMNAAIARWTSIMVSSGVTFDSPEQAQAVYRRVAESLWLKLDSAEYRSYLLKAKNQVLT